MGRRGTRLANSIGGPVRVFGLRCRFVVKKAFLMQAKGQFEKNVPLNLRRRGVISSINDSFNGIVQVAWCAVSHALFRWGLTCDKK